MRNVGSSLLPACWLALVLAAQAGAAGPRALPDAARAQIEALLREKAERTPTERKIGSQLLFAERMDRGRPPAPGVPPLRVALERDSEGRAKIDLRGVVGPELAAYVESLGGAVTSMQPRRGRLRAWLPLSALRDLAGRDDVTHVRAAGRAVTQKLDTSEGDGAHRADALRAAFGVDGAGIVVGVLSDGVDSWEALQGTGDLPDVIVLSGQAGSGDEGTAILEIVHDLAPGAELLFATAFGSQSEFADNILALGVLGADVIVDDVGYFAEAVFQDDDVALAVDAVVADGALYFSSAGNGGNFNDGTAGVWEGDYVPGGDIVLGAEVHDFGGGALTDVITKASPYVYTLHWADPKPTATSPVGASNDYDLFLLNKPGTVIFAASTDVQDGDDDPFEIIGAAPNDSGNQLVVALHPGGAPRMLHLDANRGRLSIATPGQLGGHPGARGAVAVAAVDVASAGGPGGTFDGTEPVETYSSDGPRRVFFGEAGSVLAPGGFTTAGGESRAKPDLAAADCVSTATPGFSTFCGTSAAAPHAAAIAALLLELGAGSGAIPADVLGVMMDTALDIEEAGSDRDSGAGLVDALAAADALAAGCSNGVDDDGDGLTDLADPGCASAADPSERDPAAPCDDGLDDDDDGLVDFRVGGAGDPGCKSPTWSVEDPQCQDGVDNDPSQDPDGLVDFDGGQSIHGACADGACPPGVSDPDGDGIADPDPQCSFAWRNQERTSAGCGLGAELALLAPLLAGAGRLRAGGRRRAATRSR